jgi:hypothetical protein
MKPLVACVACLPLAAAAAGCAGVLGIPDGSPTFCARPENQGHDYCEDFDVGDPSARWTFEETTPGSTLALQPSDRSPPNLLDLTVPASGTGGAIAGFDEEFDDSSFVGVHIEADVRFVSNGAPLVGGGFLLIVDKQGGCIGMAVTPAGIGAAISADASGCSALTQGLGGGGPPNGGGSPLAMFTVASRSPPPDRWFHAKIVVAPSAAKDGSGTLTLDVQGATVPSMPVPIPKGTLAPSGAPLVGFAAALPGAGPAFEAQFDNITIDLLPL